MGKLDFNNLEWGEIPENTKNVIINEMDNERIYEKFFPVEEGDVVVDFGGFVGDFIYSILHKNPEHCWIVEPIEQYFRLTYKNLKNHQVSFIHGGLSERPIIDVSFDNQAGEARGFLFKDFIKENCIDKIDFLKTDCEGAEYLIFTEENFDYIKKNVKKIAGEFHLKTHPTYSALDNLNERFRLFRDTFLIKFDKYEVFSVDGANIKWDLFNQHFLDYYQEIIIYIDNR